MTSKIYWDIPKIIVINYSLFKPWYEYIFVFRHDIDIPIYLDTEIWKASFMISQKRPKCKPNVHYSEDYWNLESIVTTGDENNQIKNLELQDQALENKIA